MRDRLSARYLRTPDAADLLGLSPRTLEKYRCLGCGPTFHKLGGRVVYAVEDLQAWADGAACQSTSDPQYVAASLTGRRASGGSAQNAQR